MSIFLARVLFSLIVGFAFTYVFAAFLASFVLWDSEVWRLPISDWSPVVRGQYLTFGSIVSVMVYFFMRDKMDGVI